MSGTDNLQLTVAWFETAMPDGPLYGDPETLAWSRDFTSIISGSRREGNEKDGCKRGPIAGFRVDPDGRQVRRKLDRVIARCAVALDVETSTETGECPAPSGYCQPPPGPRSGRGRPHSALSPPQENVRYRVILPLAAEVSPDLPAPSDRRRPPRPGGRPRPQQAQRRRLFYLPSCPYGAEHLHQTIVLPGAPLGQWLIDAAQARKAEEDRITAEAQSRRSKTRRTGSPPDSIQPIA